jgi:hypothetical protein
MRALGVVAALLAAACAEGGQTEGSNGFTVGLPVSSAAGAAGTLAAQNPAGAMAGFGGSGMQSMQPRGTGAAGLGGNAGVGSPSPPAPGGSPAPVTGGVGASGSGATAGSAAPAMPLPQGQQLPPTSDYAAMGPFPTITVNATGPGGAYTMFRPRELGANGFLHPPLTWGNGITTTPATYPILLGTVASHGFVVIASNSTAVTAANMTAGLDWLLEQNEDASSDLHGKLDPTRGVAMGYSLGGGASASAGAHPAVIATIAMHPAPGSPARLHGPLLLFSGTLDTVCSPALFVQPIFDSSPVPTFYANLEGADHLEPVLTGGRELAASIAWLRLHVFQDEGARDYFSGPNCKLCGSPWITMTKDWN